MNEMKELTDSVCGMAVDLATAIQINVEGRAYYFCEVACADMFRQDPQRWIQGAAPLHDHA